MNSLRTRHEHVVAWLQQVQPDFLCVQETKVKDSDFPTEKLSATGYNCCFHGQPSYNGVALLSRELPQQVQSGIPGYDDPQSRVLFAYFSKADIAMLNVYVPNGSEVGSEKYSYKMQWLDNLQK